MEVKLPEALVHAIGIQNLKVFEITEDSLTWNRFITINLTRIKLQDAKNLRELIEPHKEIRGAKIAIKDLETWINACSDAGSQKVRKLIHFESLLIEYVMKANGHRLFKKHDIDGQAWLCYYISRIEYHPETHNSYGTSPAYVEMQYIYEEFGMMHKGSSLFYDDDTRGKQVEEILASEGWYIETPEMRTKYLEEVKHYRELVPKIGKQYVLGGIGSDDVPDNKSYHHTTFYFSNVENANRVVIDIFFEDSKSGKDSHVELNTWFWSDKIRSAKRRDGDTSDDPTETIEEKTTGKYARTRKGIAIEDIEADPPTIEIPVHPFLIVFDLQKHLRLSVHVNYLKEYIYDKNLSEKLILPEELKSLVKILVEHKTAEFQDIIAGKSGGAIILLTGKAGVGKTLTAEVFAESEEKPLYSVQASQLGTNPTTLESNLLAILSRAARWNAILLIDEADVYVHERGNSLDQNAIVGVFLRVLEYHASVLFLTTNRPELVDDAIASRCVARIDYPYPTQENQKKIWRVLATSSKIDLSDEVINEFVSNHPSVSGRDVKNLLKLARLISIAEKKPITLAALEYVLKFKPTTVKGD